MKQSLLLIISIVLVLLTAGCSSHKKHHGTDMPDPQEFNAHFGDMDTDGDDLVNWEEFAAHFENAEKKVFDAIDLNQDGSIDHDEWHEFKAAHGLKHHD
jgi:Ca2+-binding EF-hand superfamily protein